ncbi:hypothetical protein [Desulfosporosinus fructosivorans]
MNKGYINSIFQLLDVEYLEYLRKHFVENNMLNELITIIHYKNNLVNMLLGIFGSLACSILYLYRGRQQNVIYENGIFYNDHLLNWDKVISYRWRSDNKNEFFRKGKYCILEITLQQKRIDKFFKLDNPKIKLKVNCGDREIINGILEKYTIIN